MTFPDELDIPAEVLAIARTLEDAGFEAWCVGGAVRDALLGDTAHADYDLATSATPEQVRRLFRRTVPVGMKYGTVGVLDARRALHEVTTFRQDVQTDGRHAEVVYGVSLDDDLARRDFTINAIAYHPLRHEWRDPFDGAGDLRAGRIRAVGNAATRFREDYLRVLRALRFAARFEFTIDAATWDAARAAAAGLTRLSAERVRDEWFKGLRTARTVAGLVELWCRSGAAEVWLPELGPTCRGERQPIDDGVTPRDPVLWTVALCDDPAAALRRLKASNAEIARAAALQTLPRHPYDASAPAVRRWLAAVGERAGDLRALARLLGEPTPWAAAADEVLRRGDPLTRGDLAVSGTDLQSLGAGGPQVGVLLEELLAAVLDDPSRNTRDTLLALARERL